MKTKSLLFLLLFGFTHLNAQTYYKINFSGEPDSILVENLTKGTSLTLQGNDTLSLKLSGVGVQETDRSKRTLIIYPNPMDHSCRFDFENTTYGKVEILLFNANGKKLHDFMERLSAGMHQFELSGVPAGVYHLQIKTESYRMSGSFVSTYESAPEIMLIHKKESPFRLTDGNATGNQKLAQEDVPLSFRSILVMDFSTGDQLKFTGYKTNSDDDIEFASPTGDQTIAFTFCVRPGQPTAISGNENPCVGTTQNYAVTHVDGVTYTWTVPSDWTIVSGQGSSSITVTAGSTAGNIMVTPSNNCGSGNAQAYAVTTQTVPAQPSAISGMSDPCHGTTGLIYSVTSETGVNYAWSVPTGWIITSGEATNSITVTAGTDGGNITVIPSNDCGNGIPQALAVTTQNDPIQPSAIIGKENPCQNSAETYIVTNVPGIIYTWAVPSDWTITNGQGTNSITVTVGVTTGNILVTPSNNCGYGVSSILEVTTQTGGAGQPSPITGEENPCEGTPGLVYSVVHVDGVNYTWEVPAGWEIISGQGTNSITVTAGGTAGNIMVTPSNDCGNGVARSLAVVPQTLPDQPSEIEGNSNPCCCSHQIYSVTEVPGVNYFWTVPPLCSILEGQNTHSIVVSLSDIDGNITVTPSNECGNGTTRTLTFTFSYSPVQPSPINGAVNPCQGESGLTYTVIDDPDVDYEWAVPGDWMITSGQNTNSITVTAGTATGYITVSAVNECGSGEASLLGVTTKTTPAQPSAINGNNNPCQGLTESYSVSNVSGVTYNWTVPAGWNITNGQGTNNITVNVGITGGNITLTPSNDCGNGTARTLAVTTQTEPTQPSEIAGNDYPCQGATNLIYSVTNVPGVNYFWTVPSGWTITSGQNTNSITATAGTASGNIMVTPSNDCGNGTSRTLIVNPLLVPEQPSMISGNTNPCEGETGLNYSVTNVSGVTYTWSVPSGWNITNGQGTNNIIVTAGTTSGNITVTPSNDCGSGPVRTLAVTAQLIPAQPSTISGNNNPCQGETGLNYSVTNVSGVSYFWTVPSGWNITNGQGTNSIIVTAGSTSGNITVTPSNDCGNGTSRTMAVTTKVPPAQPSAISGNNNPCQSVSESYSVTNVSGVSYFWTVPSGWTINTGQNTNSITVTVGSNTGNISVTPSNDCGNGTVQSLAVTTQTVPAQPSTISGNNNPCEAATGLNYSVTNVSGVTYTWSVPSGWNITNGQGASSITVTAGTSSGNISVTPSNTCGNGTARTLAVTAQLIPAQPSTISGNNNPCQGATGLNYSVTNVSGVTYTWSVPSGWNITSGQGTNSITVTAGTTSGNISVTPSNTCGTGTARTLAVTTQTVPAQPSTITGNTNPCQGETGVNYSVTNVSGVTYTWSVPSGWNITSGQGTNSITVTAGTTSGNISVTPSNTCGNGSSQLMAVTTQTVPATPTAGTHVPSQTQIVWNWNTVSGATGYKYNTANNYATATDNGASTTWTQTGLTCNTAYTLYVWAYNGCGNSSSLQLSQTTSACTSGCGDPVTFTYNGSTVTYGSVTSANNKCWLDRNLGATQVATSSSDAASYGHLFQWGRLDDGHQVRTSPTTTTLSNSDVPGNGSFIKVPSSPYDWRSPQNNNLWQGEGGTNNPCPDGYRLPTQAEWDTERASWSTNNAAGAFASPLKLPMAGRRYTFDGSVYYEGSFGYYWSSTVNDIYAWRLYFHSDAAVMYNDYRADGVSVRCLKD